MIKSWCQSISLTLNVSEQLTLYVLVILILIRWIIQTTKKGAFVACSTSNWIFDITSQKFWFHVQALTSVYILTRVGTLLQLLYHLICALHNPWVTKPDLFIENVIIWWFIWQNFTMEVRHLQQTNLSPLLVLTAEKWALQNQHCRSM